LNIGFIVCSSLGGIFALITIIFSILGKKAVILISGFNFKSKEERKKYDIERMSKDYRNTIFIWTLIFIIGAILSYYISKYCAVIAFVIWLIIFFKDVQLDEEKAFEKYKLK